MSAWVHQWVGASVVLYILFQFQNPTCSGCLFHLNVTRRQPNIKFNALVDLLIRIEAFAIKTDFG